MCGIIGYIGSKPVVPVLLDGLRRMEYRGYDSAGVALVSPEGIALRRSAGKLVNLETAIREEPVDGLYGVGHTRWATHGAPTDINAHPHTDSTGRIAVIHNGMIENDRALRTYLQRQGVTFRSETDTEVLAELIARNYDGDLEKAVRTALRDVSGTYGIGVMCADEPGVIVAARKGAPLIIGVGKGEHLLASDAAAILAHTTQVVYLGDGITSKTRLRGFRITGASNFVTMEEGPDPIQPDIAAPRLDKQGFFYTDGGAVKVFGRSYPVLEDLEVYDNYASPCGAGISIEHRGYQEDAAVVRRCVFRGNRSPLTGPALDVLTKLPGEKK